MARRKQKEITTGGGIRSRKNISTNSPEVVKEEKLEFTPSAILSHAKSLLKSVISSWTTFFHQSESRLALKRMVAEPGRIGMIAPSSRGLYKRMAEEVLPEQITEDTLIVEVGPGTGVGTQVLLDCGVPPHQLLCVELDPELQKHMTERFPHVKTILGDATNLESILGDKAGKVAALISAIPLKNLSKEQATTIIKACHAVIKPEGKMTQFTYGFRPTFKVEGFQRKFGGFVLFNLPPAFVWTFTKVT